jgi:hypothetical protein
MKECTKVYIELNNKNRILEHLIRHLGEMIDNNELKRFFGTRSLRKTGNMTFGTAPS